MSSNLRINKICEFCNKDFVAKTTVTKYCSHVCARKNYKQKLKEEKILQSIQKTNTQKRYIENDLEIETLNSKHVLSIKEACAFIGVSRSTIYRILKDGKLKHAKFGTRTLIHKNDLSNLFK